MATHCMVDLETLSTKTFPALLSIGAVLFDPAADNVPVTMPPDNKPQDLLLCALHEISIVNSFYSLIDIDTCTAMGANIEQFTVLWWMGDDLAEARKAAFAKDNRVGIYPALKHFCEWAQHWNVEYIWSHGLTFDVAALQKYFELLGIKQPVHWRNYNDTRTLFRLCPEDALQVDKRLPLEVATLPPHHPVFDCWKQARMVQQAYAYLNQGIVTVDQVRNEQR